MAKKTQPTDIPPGGMVILQATKVYPTAAVLELAHAAFAACPEPGQALSPEYRKALIDLRNALPSERQWAGWTQATGEPEPLSLEEMTRQAAPQQADRPRAEGQPKRSMWPSPAFRGVGARQFACDTWRATT